MQHLQVLHATASRLAESAVWHAASGSICWLDNLARTLFRHDLSTGETKSFPVDVPNQLGALIATSDPSLFLISGGNGLSVIDLEGRVRRHFADPESGRDEIGYNDCKMDRFGRLWVGTYHLPETEPRGVLWCLRGDGTALVGDAGFPVSNGPAISPDGRRLYFNDSVGRRTFVYDLDPGDPMPRNRRVLVEHAHGLPDGMTVDTEGGLWIAFWEGSQVARYSPDGAVTDTIALPCPNVTSVCFAGPALDMLVITTAREGMSEADVSAHPEAGHVFWCKPGRTGLPEPLFDLR